MAHFFISYTQADHAWAEWIGWVLEEAGYKTKIQVWDFRPGTNFVVEMDNATRKAERTLIVLSPNYLYSSFGKAEWATAFARDPTGEKGVLLPVRVREMDVEGLLGQVVYIDLVGLDEGAARERLQAGLARGRAKPLKPPVFPGNPHPQFPGELTSPPALPEDEIPEPGPLPAGSRMPLSRNPLFVGRQEDLRALARQLKAGQTSAIGQVETAAATGLGGIGKTQLASEFVHRYGRFFAGGVFWMSFADPAAVPAEIVTCGRRLNLHPDYDALPLDHQVRLVEEAWQRFLPRLLVFDNCEEEDILDRWRPRFGGARVLVTSRRSQWDRGLGVQAIPLGILPRSSSIELLRRFCPDVPSDDSGLNGIAEELGDLPLALHLAGSFLERYRNSSFGQPLAYLESLQRNGLLDHPSLQGKGSKISPTGHEAHVARTFALSFERLNLEDDTDGLAAMFLILAANFAPGEPIPFDLLLKVTHLEPQNTDAELQAHDALGRLIDLGLVGMREDRSLVLHRLIAEFARGTVDSEYSEKAREAVEVTIFREAEELNERGFPAPLLVWQVHLRAVTEEALNREDEGAADLCNVLGGHLWIIGNLLEAQTYWERALVIREKVLGPEHPQTTDSLNNLGVLLHAQGNLSEDDPQGKFSEALLYYQRALLIREKVLGEEHPHTAQSLNHIGALLRDQGEFARSQAYIEQALAIREKVLGPEHPDTAFSLVDLGSLFLAQGNLTDAKIYIERSLSIREKVLGPEHPDTAISLNKLGLLLWKQRDLIGARVHFKKAIAISEKTLGSHHPWTKNARKNLQLLDLDVP